MCVNASLGTLPACLGSVYRHKHCTADFGTDGRNIAALSGFDWVRKDVDISTGGSVVSYNVLSFPDLLVACIHAKLGLRDRE
jgi:hypothetical protein